MGIFDIEVGFNEFDKWVKYPSGVAILVKQKSYQELLVELLPKIRGFIESHGWEIIEQKTKIFSSSERVSKR